MRLTFAIVIVPTLLRGVLPAAVTAVGGSWRGAPKEGCKGEGYGGEAGHAWLP